MEATRYLLMEAFKEPLNQRFVLVSESDIPLYDPLTLYSELMSDSLSRINAWPGPGTGADRWSPRMEVSGGRPTYQKWELVGLGGLPNSRGVDDLLPAQPTVKRGYLCVCLQSPELNRTLWRKSAQWFTLIREHAAVVLDDVSIFRSFQAHCNGYGWDADLNATRGCYSDEVRRASPA